MAAIPSEGSAGQKPKSLGAWPDAEPLDVTPIPEPKPVPVPRKPPKPETKPDVRPSARPGAARQAPLQKIVVAEMRSQTGDIDPRLFRVAEEQMAIEIGKTGRYSVIGRDDINRMLDSMQQRQMMGCTDVECYVQIGGAMGADLMVAGTMDKVGTTVMIAVKLINIANAEVLNRESEKIREPNPEEIVPRNNDYREPTRCLTRKAT
jgi:hypothetical protein